MAEPGPMERLLLTELDAAIARTKRDALLARELRPQTDDLLSEIVQFLADGDEQRS